MKKWCLLVSITSLPLLTTAFEGELGSQEEIKPWFTGPILATSGNVVPIGHINFQPYIIAFARTSFYDNHWNSQPIDTLWNLQFRTPGWIGLTQWADLKLSPVWSWNYRDGQAQWTLNDCSAQLSIQLYKDTLPYKNWLPSIKVCLRETFPTGKYQKLNPDKLGTDGGGMGTYATAVSINFSKILSFPGAQFLNLRLNALYSFPTSLHVKGFNAYGGGAGTDGIVDPEKTVILIFAFEYAFTRNWVIACDFQGLYSSKTHFRGKPGMVPRSDSDINPAGIPARSENQAAIQYSATPSIEYNWSENVGVLAGVWLTLGGKNSSHFTTGVITLNYYR